MQAMNSNQKTEEYVMLGNVKIDKRLLEIGREIATQDNLSTKDPMVIVFDKVKVPTLEDYAEDYVYYYLDGDYEEIGKTASDILKWCEDHEIKVEASGDMHPDDLLEYIQNLGYERMDKMWYVEKENFVASFFTMKEAKEYVKSNKHHHPNLTIYMESTWKMWEMKIVRDLLIQLHRSAPEDQAQPPAQDPIVEAYEQFKHLDNLLSDEEWVGNSVGRTCHILWLAVKEYVNRKNKF